MGLLAHVLRPSGLTHGRPPLSLSTESRRRGTHGTKPCQQPSSAWQESFNPDQPNLTVLAKLSSVLFDLEQLVECILALVE
jgi:hypothetical protein